MDYNKMSDKNYNTMLRMISLMGYDELLEIVLERKGRYPYTAMMNEMYGNKQRLTKESYNYILRYKLNLTQYKEGEYNEPNE